MAESVVLDKPKLFNIPAQKTIFYDLEHFLSQIRRHRDVVKKIYSTEPQYLKVEKIEQAKVEYYNAVMQFEKSQDLLWLFKKYYPVPPLVEVLEQNLKSSFSELKSYCLFIRKMHPVDLYARNYRLKPGKLLQFRKFRNVETGRMVGGKELLEVLKKAYVQFHLKTKVTLNKAAQILEPVAKSYPDYLPAVFWLARVYFEMEKIDEAEFLLGRLLEVDPHLVVSKSLDAKMLSGDDLIEYSVLREEPYENKLPKAHEPVDLSQREVRSQREEIRRVPFVFAVGNSKGAYPQSGLEFADVVFEVPVEGGITRFLAMYGNLNEQSIPIGPIRSMRPYFLDLVYNMNPFFVHCGSSPGGARRKQELDFYTHDELGGYSSFWRESNRKKPFNLFTSLERLRDPAYTRKKIWGNVYSWLKTTTTGYPHSDNTVASVEIPFYGTYKVLYSYDAAKSAWQRKARGRIQTETDSKEPLQIHNIIIMHVDEQVMDEQGRLDLDVYGQGKMFAFVKGKQINGTWEKGSELESIRFADESGKEVMLWKGKTWIHLLSNRKQPKIKYHDKIASGNK
jgi:tetratricopeptide (TPR) repeat protein